MAKVKDLESELRNYLENAPETAEIIMRVTDFREVLHTTANDRGVQHKVTMRKNHPRVSVYQNNKTGLPTLKVKEGAGPITFKFKIVDEEISDRFKDTYYPLGIAFEWQGSTQLIGTRKPDMVGRSNFPIERTHVYGDSLYVTDLLISRAEGAQYKFSLIIQRERDGKIGIIDPGIEHENEI